MEAEAEEGAADSEEVAEGAVDSEEVAESEGVVDLEEVAELEGVDDLEGVVDPDFQEVRVSRCQDRNGPRATRNQAMEAIMEQSSLVLPSMYQRRRLWGWERAQDFMVDMVLVCTGPWQCTGSTTGTSCTCS